MITRPVAAACAGCLATMATFPLDAWKVRTQIASTQRVRRPFVGLEIDLPCKFVATVVYAHTYESVFRASGSPLHASVLGVTTSCLFTAPTDVWKRRRQARANGWGGGGGRGRGRRGVWAKSYAVHLVRNGPRSVLKYVLYEPLLAHCQRIGYSPSTSGAISACIASLCVSTMLFPLDVVKTHLALGLPIPVDPRRWFYGVWWGILQSVLTNTLGHGLLEWWCPRTVC